MEENNKETKKYNIVMTNLTLVLFVVAVIQIIVQIWLSGLDQWPKAGLSTVVMLIVVWAFWYMFKEDKKKA